MNTSKLKIENRPVADLIPYARNARTHSDEQVAQIAASIREFGFNDPIAVDGENGIIEGHGRVLAARKLGMDTVPVIELRHMSDAQKRAYMLAHNRIAERAAWDMDMLEIEMGELRELGFDVELAGWTGEELEELEKEFTGGGAGGGLTDPDDIPDIEEEEEPITQPGDLWLLGEHRLLCGDSTKEEDVDRVMGGVNIDIVVLDPPFELSEKQWSKWIYDPCVMFGLGKHFRLIPENLYRFERVLIKKYRHRSPTTQIDSRHSLIVQIGSIKHTPKNKKTYSSVVEQEFNHDHRHAKPVGVLIEHLKCWSPPWSVVFDPFCGLGSTIIAAEMIERKCFGIEIHPVHCDAIVRRWEEFTGISAAKESI